MLRVIVLGCGKIGSVMARDFSESNRGAEVVLADRSGERAREAAAGIEGAGWVALDTADRPELVRALKGFDLVLGALPGDYGYEALEASVDAGVDMVDVSYTPEIPLELDRPAKEAGVTVIPDCGVAPGLSSILVGRAASRLDRVESAHILVGGIPEIPVPPLGYTITWSAEGLIDEYVREVSVVEGGLVVRVPALSGLEEVDFPGVGRLEAFYTDGLRTLVDSLPGVDSMYEKTLRYPGHVEGVRLLRELGFFDEETLEVEGRRVSPRLLTARLLERSLRRPEVGDLLAMIVEVRGEAGGEASGYSYYVLDRFDRAGGVTAMARTTAYTASIVAGMLAGGAIEEKGVIPPERLGMNERITEGLLSELGKRGVIVEASSL
ncbi:MAG: saccharopine dehydrogenase family protein [Candidatus Bathyarchaeota archaeon]|nr:saccharopine dehydrogenase family protein [Candidatus Bathyarchaeota archaeon]